MSNTMAIAENIRMQLGGNRFTVMTGAKDFLATGNGLRFSIPRNKSKANRVEILLNGLDLYDIRFYRLAGPRTVVNHKKGTVVFKPPVNETVREFHDIYCDQLEELFTEVTGMYTRL